MEKEITDEVCAGGLTSRFITSTLVNTCCIVTPGYSSTLPLFLCLLLRCVIHEICIYKHAQLSETSPDERE